MKYVLDASVAVKWVLPESETREALSLREDFRNQVHELIAPDVLLVEVAHALTRAERRGFIGQAESIMKLMDVMTTAPDFYPNGPLLLRAVEISSQARIGVYDCLYLALAEREQCDVVTADQRGVEAGGDAGVMPAADEQASAHRQPDRAQPDQGPLLAPPGEPAAQHGQDDDHHHQGGHLGEQGGTQGNPNG